MSRVATMTEESWKLAFPFALQVDRTMQVVSCGELLLRVCPEVAGGATLGDCFVLPPNERLRSGFDALAASAGSLQILQRRSDRATPPLRGQWMRLDDDHLLFLGWPWVTSFGQLSDMGVRLSEIPAHNPLAEMLMLLQTNRGAMQDAHELAEALRRQQAALEQANSELSHRAFHDALTGLPNRLMLRDRLSQALLRAQRKQTSLAVMFIDLDRFKAVNDTLGHRIGDRLLCAVAERVAAQLRKSDTVAREGGDEFLVLLEEVGDAANAGKVADKLLQALSSPYLIEGHSLHCGGSIGIAMYPGDGEDAEQLIKHADAAMFESKGQGRGQLHFFSPESWRRIAQRFTLEAELRVALEQGQFEVFYQPQVALPSRRICGAEALLRWRHPQRGLVPPMEFIPLAEEIGLILPIGEWVLDAVCAQIAAWHARFGWSPSVAVNVSARQLEQHDFAQKVDAALTRHRVPAGLLELELTEHSLMQQHRRSAELLQVLKRRGVRLVLDDFGTGYSNLMTLSSMPFDMLKIDRSFVARMDEGAPGRALVSMITSLAGQLALKVVAEGVETEAQQAMVASMGCDIVQGYLHSPPLPRASFESLALVRDAA